MKTHGFDAVSFVSGLVMTLIGIIFLIPADPTDVFGYIGEVGDWFWPVLLIAVGVAVLAPLASRTTPEDTSEESEDG